VANVSLQPSTEQLYEGFTATIYPNVQENLKLAVEEPVLLEEPASSSGTLASLQHLSIDFTFGDQFVCNKPSDADKSAETKVELMVNVLIQEAMSSISLMTSPIIDLTLRPESPKEHPKLKATTTDTTTTTTITTHSGQSDPCKQNHGGEVGQTWGASVYTRTIGHPSAGEHRCPSGTLRDPRASGSQVTPPPPPPPTSTNQDNLEYLRYGSKGRRPALSISKMKAAYYPNAGLEQMVPDQFWIEEECKYDIATMYGISHWWFQRQRFYIDRQTFEGVLDQQDESRSKYMVLDQEGRRSVQRIHVRNSEAFEDTENVPQLGELCWRTRKRGRLQIVEAYRLIKLLQHYRPLSDDL
nr:hypothetical protein [Tanacetum cinerariifolium]